MVTIGEALADAERLLFVGRERELALFEGWLDSDPHRPQIFEVSGPGGIGKSSLLAAFRRLAEARGRDVVEADLHGRAATPTSFLSQLGGPDVRAVAARLNRRQPLVLLDTLDASGDLQRVLAEELVPLLDVEVKVVVAGRSRLSHVWRAERPMRAGIRAVELSGLTSDASRTYLTRRGVSDPRLREQIHAVVGGHPLALSLAADLVLNMGLRDFGMSTERHLLIRSLAEQLLRPVIDPDLREQIEACSIVEQFDQSTLEAILARPVGAHAFDQLCRLSVVRPAPHGLMLHEDVRRILADDLRWRHKEEFRRFRLRAMAHFGERMRSAVASEREWLLAQRLYLWEHAFVQTMLFGQDDPGELSVGPGTCEDEPQALEIEMIWHSQIVPRLGLAQCEPDPDDDLAAHRVDMAYLLGLPGRRLRIARDQDGQALGFSLVAFVNGVSAKYLVQHRVFGPLLRAYFDRFGWESLPSSTESTRIAYFLHVRHKGTKAEAVTAALIRDLLSVFERQGIVLVTAVMPEYRQLLHALGFERLPVEYPRVCGADFPTEAYVLDLEQIGLETWINAVMAGRHPPRALAPDELERAVQDALSHWHDDRWLADSTLAHSAVVAGSEPSDNGSEAVRRAIQHALQRIAKGAPPEMVLACRAVQGAYLGRTGSHERIAEELAVSRTTFYRLLRRGVRAAALALATG